MTHKKITIIVFKNYSIATIQAGKYSSSDEVEKAITALKAHPDFVASYDVLVELPE